MQPEGNGPQIPRTRPRGGKRKPTEEPTTVTDPAPPLQTTISVEPTHPKGTPKKGATTEAPPPETQGEPEQTLETGAEEGKEYMATARTLTPPQAPAKSKKKSKHLKKKADCSSGDKEEIEKAWKQVKSQRLQEKCRKEKEERGERRWARTKGKQSPPLEEPQTEPLKDEEMERGEVVNQPPPKKNQEERGNGKGRKTSTPQRRIISLPKPRTKMIATPPSTLMRRT
ncbi:hypothetical protein NDU88_005322 [Pleurodeles waltl]|uniref:Uncharacterized protein n=1 Tax=Pleurodeles waltl TaxID=8319 RepID=A0AAV7W992_PLEWA|nr:hypothetical protein NDU88_005322 [Pleurodeles waltl]